MAQPRTDTRTPNYPAAQANWSNSIGLLAWLAAMLMAISGPLFGLAFPAWLVVGTVIFSALVSLISISQLIGQRPHDDHDHPATP